MKKKQKQNSQLNTTTAPKEKLDVEIDYNKLADALLKAEEKIAEEKAKQFQAEQERHQMEWEKALKCKRYRGDKKIRKALDGLTWNFRFIFGIITFKKKDATTENATYILFKMFNVFLLMIYQYLFYILMLYAFFCILKDNKFSQLFPIGKSSYFILSILFFIIAQIIRIAKYETTNSQDKETIITIFNAIVPFTAMVFTIISVIIALVK